MTETAIPGAGLSLYLHIPFCQVRCAYCDFNTYAGLDQLMPAYTQALAKEVRWVGDLTAHPSPLSIANGEGEGGGVPPQGAGWRVRSIFFGGGTPSLLPLDMLSQIFGALRESFALAGDCEITLEANPGTLSRAYLDGLRELGVNRLSFGVQSSHPHELRLLDRLHLFGDAAQAVTWARQAGFDNLNLDVIFSLPGQTLAEWQATLLRVLALGPEHLSAYALSLEHGTPLRAWVHRGLLPMPDPDLAAEMYTWADETLAANGFVQYEISNWAREAPAKGEGPRTRDDSLPVSDPPPLTSNPRPLTCDFQPLISAHQPPHNACRHNLQYWRNLPYLGFGAGAHGFAAGRRYANVLSPQVYIARLAEDGAPRDFPLSPAAAQVTPVSRADEMGETMMLGLRLTREGVREAGFRARFGLGLGEQYPRQLKRLQALGLLEWDAGGARLSRPGRLLGNRVFREFV